MQPTDVACALGVALAARPAEERRAGDESMIGRYFTVELTGTTGSTFTGALVETRRALPMAG